MEQQSIDNTDTCKGKKHAHSHFGVEAFSTVNGTCNNVIMLAGY